MNKMLVYHSSNHLESFLPQFREDPLIKMRQRRHNGDVVNTLHRSTNQHLKIFVFREGGFQSPKSSPVLRCVTAMTKYVHFTTSVAVFRSPFSSVHLNISDNGAQLNILKNNIFVANYTLSNPTLVNDFITSHLSTVRYPCSR